MQREGLQNSSTTKIALRPCEHMETQLKTRIEYLLRDARILLDKIYDDILSLPGLPRRLDCEGLPCESAGP